MKKQCKREEISNRNDKGFLSGLFLLSLSTVLVKLIGLAYKIPMLDLLGTLGMGYFNSAYEVYAMLCVISTAGLPVALSMMIAAKKESASDSDVQSVYRTAWKVFLLLGSAGTALMLFFAQEIANLIGNPASSACLAAMAPSLLLICLCGAVRGYFQGLNRMGPTAVSQLLESLGKLIFGVGLSTWALLHRFSVSMVAAFAALGLTLGILVSAVYLLAVKAADRKKLSRTKLSSEKVLSDLLKIAVPITLGSILMSSSKLMDLTLMMHRLPKLGLDSLEINRLYGSYTTLAVPVFGLIPSLITPISLVLVPQLSAAIERKDAERQSKLVDDSIRLTVLLSMPSSLGLAVFASPILKLLFSGQQEAVETAAPLLALLGASVLFSGLITTTNAILQSYRHPGIPILSMAFGVLVKGVSAFFLMGLSSVGVMGAPVSTFLCNVSITAINYAFLTHNVPKSDRASGLIQMYGKPLLASVGALAVSVCLFSALTQRSCPLLPTLGIAFGGFVSVYAALAFMTKIVTVDDIAMLPFGEKIFNRYRLKKEKRIHHDNQ